MGKEELIKFLKEHLKVEIDIEGGDYGSSKYIRVKLLIDKEVITSSDTYLGN